jgi:hypothetical protein
MNQTQTTGMGGTSRARQTQQMISQSHQNNDPKFAT